MAQVAARHAACDTWGGGRQKENAMHKLELTDEERDTLLRALKNEAEDAHMIHDLSPNEDGVVASEEWEAKVRAVMERVKHSDEEDKRNDT